MPPFDPQRLNPAGSLFLTRPTLATYTAKRADMVASAESLFGAVETGKVEIVSMNHGFTVDRDSLPDAVTETHVSLFDGSNTGIRSKSRPVFSVQYHPEASPGPRDSHYLFDRFAALIDARRNRAA